MRPILFLTSPATAELFAYPEKTRTFCTFANVE
jgi:hypothetical protein